MIVAMNAVENNRNAGIVVDIAAPNGGKKDEKINKQYWTEERDTYS